MRRKPTKTRRRRPAQTSEPDAWTLVIGDMQARRTLGLKRYGKLVMPSDRFENWLQHLYEERLDELVYLRAEIERRRREKKRGD